MNYFEDEIFRGLKQLHRGEYEYCTFINCDFSEADLSGFKFLECEFEGCNLSLVTVNGTGFTDVTFTECKLLGVAFDKCEPFNLGLTFQHCVLSNSSFYKLKLKNSKFIHSKLVEVDFVESDLSSAVFEECDLSGALFEQTNLEKADFRTALHYSINPEFNKLKGALFSKDNLVGLVQHLKLRIQ